MIVLATVRNDIKLSILYLQYHLVFVSVERYIRLIWRLPWWMNVSHAVIRKMNYWQIGRTPWAMDADYRKMPWQEHGRGVEMLFLLTVRNDIKLSILYLQYHPVSVSVERNIRHIWRMPRWMNVSHAVQNEFIQTTNIMNTPWGFYPPHGRYQLSHIWQKHRIDEE